MSAHQMHTHAPAPMVQQRTYGFCRGSRHGQPKRITHWSKEGLLAWCNSCHAEVLFSWTQIDEIRAGLQRPENVV